MKCAVCDIEMPTDKAKTCSPRCRQTLHRRESVTGLPSVTRKKEESVTFRFTVTYKPLNDMQTDIAKERSRIREAKYWYDVPLGAVPVREDGWPEMPEYMNGRQYFLWWKNEFKTNQDPSKGEIGMPVILDPLPVRDNVKYLLGGPDARMWSGR